MVTNMLLLDDDGTEDERASCWLRMDGVIGVDPVAWIAQQACAPVGK